MTTAPARPTTTGSWLVPAGLILLTLIPVISGSLRLAQLSGAVAILPEAERFTSFPLPVILHIVSATLFSIVGAFQFVPQLRKRSRWHQRAGRVLMPAGLVVALSGLWMALFSALPASDGVLLLGMRLLFGSLMVLSIVLAARAIIQRRFAVHGAWMTRAYALGVAAGTQALVLIPVSVAVGSSHELGRALAMGAAWLANLGVAELAIRRRARR